MARKRTKKQKLKSKVKAVSIKPSSSNSIANKSIKVSSSDMSKNALRSVDTGKSDKIKSTTFSKTQVSLLQKDLLKTLITTFVVVGFLAVIYFKSKGL